MDKFRALLIRLYSRPGYSCSECGYGPFSFPRAIYDHIRYWQDFHDEHWHARIKEG
jgi:hypothetical protein